MCIDDEWVQMGERVKQSYEEKWALFMINTKAQLLNAEKRKITVVNTQEMGWKN